MTRPLAILLALVSAAVGAPRNPMREAQKLKAAGKPVAAIAQAMSAARDEGQEADRRSAAFQFAAETYKEIGCPRRAVGVYREATAALGPKSPHAAGLWWRAADVCRSHLGAEDTARFLESVLPDLDLGKSPPRDSARLLVRLADARLAVGQPRKARDAAWAAAKLAVNSDVHAAATTALARLHARLREFGKALECLGRLDDTLDDRDVAYEVGRAYRELIDGLAQGGRHEKLPALCRRAVQLFASREASTAQKAIEVLLATAGDEAAMSFVTGLGDDAVAAIASDTLLPPLVGAALRTRKADDLVRVCVRAMLSKPLDEQVARACLKAIVGLRIRQGRTGDALAAAHAAYSVTGFSSASNTYFSHGVALVAHALRARDGHLVSGNVFRTYQVVGPAGRDGRRGSADDLANPLAGVAFKAEPELARLFQAALDAQPLSGQGRRKRAWVYLLWCKPRDALRELKRAFAMCSFEPTELNRAAQDIANGLKALHATPVGMDAFANFQQYGPNGPDRRRGTRDDLKDPLAGL